MDDDFPDAFDAAARAAVYEAIARRRDIRHFRSGTSIGEAVLMRILAAAHAAPSVGLSQRWRFIIVRDRGRRARIRDSFLRVRATEAERFPAERRAAYLALRLEGILDAALNLCVVVDERARDPVLGTTAQPETIRAGVYCAIQNLWLAARAEGVGVGWVSIVEPEVLRAELALPAGVAPVAYLCMGSPVAFGPRPMLEEAGWEQRVPLSSVVFDERYEERP